MKVYLSGPMTGLPDHGFNAFEEAANRIRSNSTVEVLSPHELAEDVEVMRDMGGRIVCVSTLPEFSRFRAMERDLEAVIEADVIVVLPGWEDSPGAMVEVNVAEALGKPVVSLTDVFDEFATAPVRFMLGIA